MGTYGRLGPYELIGELGRGAMARVWRAWDPNLEREVAIKEPLFDPRLSDTMTDELGKRFVGEGRAAARLSHSGIVTIYAADVWDGRPAIVMELVEGETLTQRLDRGPLAPVEALGYLDQLLDAVGYAHAHGVVHRDIKPDNIFVTPTGRVKLADFGIARVDDARLTMGTAAGAVLGTPGYMSPEQATGAPVDARSDLFSVGVVAYEMLAGSNPFGAGYGSNVTTLLYRIVHEPVPELPPAAAAGLPADLRPAIMCALEKNPADRPQSADELRAMLHGRLAVSQTHTTGTNVAYQTRLVTNMVSDGGVQAVDPGVRGTAGASRAQHVLQSDTARHYQQRSDTAYSSRSYARDDDQRGYGHGPARGTVRWLPLMALVGVAAVALALVLTSLLGGTNEGKGSGSAGGTAEGSSSAAESSAEEATSTSYYLAVSDGHVAIFSNDAATPYEVSDVAVADLGAASAAELDAHVPADTVDEAERLLEEYRAEAEAAKRAAEQKAQEEAERKAQEEAEEQARQEAEAAAAAAAAGSSVELTVVGGDGTSRTATIHRQGTSERVFPDSNTRYLSEGEVAALSDAERCIAWNEIIAASNGYAFKNSGLAAYFANCSWYYRNPGASSGGILTDAGKANVNLLQAYTSAWWKDLAAY